MSRSLFRLCSSCSSRCGKWKKVSISNRKALSQSMNWPSLCSSLNIILYKWDSRTNRFNKKIKLFLWFKSNKFLSKHLNRKRKRYFGFKKCLKRRKTNFKCREKLKITLIIIKIRSKRRANKRKLLNFGEQHIKIITSEALK